MADFIRIQKHRIVSLDGIRELSIDDDGTAILTHRDLAEVAFPADGLTYTALTHLTGDELLFKAHKGCDVPMPLTQATAGMRGRLTCTLIPTDGAVTRLTGIMEAKPAPEIGETETKTETKTETETETETEPRFQVGDRVRVTQSIAGLPESVIGSVGKVLAFDKIGLAHVAFDADILNIEGDSQDEYGGGWWCWCKSLEIAPEPAHEFKVGDWIRITEDRDALARIYVPMEYIAEVAGSVRQIYKINDVRGTCLRFEVPGYDQDIWVRPGMATLAEAPEAPEEAPEPAHEFKAGDWIRVTEDRDALNSIGIRGDDADALMGTVQEITWISKETGNLHFRTSPGSSWYVKPSMATPAEHPIQVGDTVVSRMGNRYEVLALDDCLAWCKSPSCGHPTFRLEHLRPVED